MRWTAVGALVCGAVFVVFGCSSNPSGGSTAGDGGVTFEGPGPKALAKATCARATACSPALAAAVGGPAGCEAGIEETVAGALAVKGSTWDDASLRECAQRVSTLPCGLVDFQNPIAPCSPRNGSLAAGGGCQFDWQCATGACSSAGPDGCGTCVKKTVAGDDCATTNCTSGFQCTGPEQTCKPIPTLGDACEGSCQDPFVCGLSGRCAYIDRTDFGCTDENPLESRDCQGTPGLVCNPVRARCEQALVANEVGAPCLFDRTAGTLTLCGANLYCAITDAARLVGECVPRKALGDACTPQDGFPTSCPFPSRCVNGSCAVEPLTRCGAFDPTKCTQTVCGETCVDVKFDPANCGTCGNACSGAKFACIDGTCACPVGQRFCGGACVVNDAQNCGACGVTCSGATPYCDGLACVAIAPPPSCADGPVCSGGRSCCEAKSIPAGTFSMGRSDPGPETDACDNAGCFGIDAEVPAHDVTLSAYKLDTYEVTVGRFRKFVEGYPGNKPAVGAGANPAVATSGWRPVWDTQLAATKQELIERLKCSPEHRVEPWTDRPGANENRPMNCVDWFTAFAFCAWDGGHLPTEAEWEYAAAGGSENRVYPWGNAAPDHTRAVYECVASGDTYGGYDGCLSLADLPSVGSVPAGVGRRGNHDLAGSLFEWTVHNGTYVSTPQTNPAELSDEGGGVRRGGSYGAFKASLRAAMREGQYAAVSVTWMGFRCAR